MSLPLRTLGIIGAAALATCLLVAPASQARAETVPTPGPTDGRVRSARYDADQVYRLRAYVGYEIDLQFESGESFVGIGAGDIDGVSFAARDNHLFIKPKAQKVATNLTIVTSRRTYQLDYTVSERRPVGDLTGVIYAVRFLYPDSAAVASQAREVSAALHTPETQHARNTNYWYCGSRAIQPVAASDDGVHTRLRFAAGAEQPAIFARNDDGSESLVNFSMEGDEIVIHRLVRELAVRRGRLAGRIVNKGFAGAARRLGSETISPQVDRALSASPVITGRAP